ncbi:hypothetical protein [Actinocorallia longicatena]|uniref:Fibronectin type-III domain-containing protein n=1 Tax=Actinocorallia longicatena TaxID=111803 RepID=A0ABP6Q1G5_9ACTN
MIDKTAYLRDVLDPARRAASARPDDLFVRYALDPDKRLDDAAFSRHLEEMERYWRSLTQKRLYLKLAESLMAGHQELAAAGKLTWEAFTADRTARRAAARARLDQQIDGLKATTPCVSGATVRHLAGEVWSEADVRAHLAKAGLRVVDPLWEPPAPPAGHRALREQLTLLGLKLSVQLVFGEDVLRRGFKLRGGFRTNAGAALTAADVQKVVEQSRGRPRDERKTAADGILSVLENALKRPGAVDALLVWETAEVLRPSAEARLPIRLIADAAIALGLDPREAEDLALALSEGLTAGAGTSIRAQVEEALAEGALRAAERLAGGLGTEDAEVRARVEESLRKVGEASARASAHLAAGRSEEAAEELAGAARLAADDEELPRRLAAIPPPPVRRVSAALAGDRVTVSWTPGDVRAGPVTHRVVRTSGEPAAAPADGTVLGDFTGTEAADTAPPVGVRTRYTVFSRRAEGAWSAPAPAPAVRHLPEVGEVVVTATERAVRVAWSAHPDLAEARVVRLDGAGRTSKGIRASRDGFADDGVEPGTEYRYRIQAVYRAGGGLEASEGIEVTARPEAAPHRVAALTVRAEGSGTAVIRWRDPSSGRVVIRSAAAPPSWAEENRVPVQEVDRYGGEVPGTPVKDGVWSSLTTTIGAERRYFTAVTVGGGTAIIGPTGSIKVVQPVRFLTSRRLGDKAVVSWEWPEGAKTAVVAWTPAGASTAETREISKRGFTDNRGCELRIGASGGSVAVHVIDRDAEGVAESPPVRIRIAARGVRVRYQFRRRLSLPFLPMRARLRLTADEACYLPDLIVVHGTGSTLPLRPEQGEVLSRVPAARLAPGAPVEVDLTVPRSRRTWLVCFADGDGADRVILNRVKGTW